MANLFEQIESGVVSLLMRMPDGLVERLTKERWMVDGEPFDRRTQYLFHLSRRNQRSMPDIPLEDARRYYHRVCQVLDSPPPPIERMQALEIPTRLGSLDARVYYPPGTHEAAGPLPCLIYYHGGGFTIGSLDTHDALCRRLCALAKCVVVSPDYRLAPEHPFPAAVEDSYDVYTWVRDNAGTLGIAVDQLGVGGDSAGGNLAATIAAIARDQAAPLPKVQLLIYPAVGTIDHPGRKKPELQSGYGLDAKTTAWFAECYVPKGQEGNPGIAPLHLASHRNLPPAIIVTAQFDLLCEEGIEYVNVLRDAETPVTHLHYTDLPHGFATMCALPRANEAMTEVANALRAAL